MHNEFWLGVLIGVPVGAFAWGWLKPLVFVVALVLADVVPTTSAKHTIEHVHYKVPPALIGLIAVLFGLWSWHYARKQGLKNLGAAELKTRWTNVKGVSKWGW